MNAGRLARWLCKSGCHYTRKTGAAPCINCCGYARDERKHYQGRSTAATKN